MSDRRRGIMNSIAAGIALAAMAAPAAPAFAGQRDPGVTIGVLDMQARRSLDQDAGVRVVYREFVQAPSKAGGRPTASGHDHGEIVLTSAVREIRRIDRSVPITVYAANAFEMTDGGKGYRMRFDKAVEALRWMKGNGVTVVATSFNTTNANGSKLLMDEAERLGMTVFAGSSNSAGAGRVLPAADPRSISVADTTPSGSSLTLDASVQDWVKFAIRGDWSDETIGGAVTDWGASYASAKAAGYGAYYSYRNPGARRTDVEAALKATSRVVSIKCGKDKATMATLGLGDMPQQFRRYAQGAARAASPAIGPVVARGFDLGAVPAPVSASR